MELLAVLFVIVTPLLGLLLRLNARDRCRDALLATMWDLVPRNLCGSIAVHVRCALLSRRTVVDVDMGDCTCDEIWQLLSRWRAGLPGHVRLLARARMAHESATDFTIDAV